ncbi:hypothetical protein [Streptomyces sp. NPDC048606]|uniref:hypothetical protein n=1 Tax=Streptomyces sp. NPDC048606 TaxID=3154726 RepID=UPI00341A54C3
MTMRWTATPALLAAGVALAGCAGTPAKDDGGPDGDPTAAVVAVAREYQEAVLQLDWRRACELSTPSQRAGTVEECASRNLGPSPSPPAPSPSAEPSDDGWNFSPPVRADGSTVQPRPSRSKSPGPERASTGPLTQEGVPVRVPATTTHPAGWAVMLTYAVVWPTETSTARRALRIVEDAGTWHVDQREDVKDTDISHGGNPAANALTRG